MKVTKPTSLSSFSLFVYIFKPINAAGIVDHMEGDNTLFLTLLMIGTLGPLTLCMFCYVMCHERWQSCFGRNNREDDYNNDDYIEHEYDSGVLEIHRVNVVDNLLEDNESFKKFDSTNSGNYEPPSGVLIGDFSGSPSRSSYKVGQSM